jgi:hypothetical protein
MIERSASPSPTVVRPNPRIISNEKFGIFSPPAGTLLRHGQPGQGSCSLPLSAMRELLHLRPRWPRGRIGTFADAVPLDGLTLKADERVAELFYERGDAEPFALRRCRRQSTPTLHGLASAPPCLLSPP